MSHSPIRRMLSPSNRDIELVSGAYLDLLNPDPKTITLDVVAHGLSNVCRYAGQTKRFYSVAEHACLVAAKLGLDGYSLDFQLAGLHHDDPEAFIADITSPLKKLLQPAYGDIEKRLDNVIALALGLPIYSTESPIARAVKEADEWALAAEAYHLMPSQGHGWWCEGLYDPDEQSPMVPQGFAPGEAYEMWVGFHNGIVRQASFS